MGTITEEAKAYEPPKTKNISELDKVSTKSEVVEKEFTREDGTTFKVKVINVEGEDYRLPTSVLKSLKAILTEKPEIEFFKVVKTGEGLKTEYTVVSIEKN